MGKIAVITGHTFLYWSTIVVALAGAGAACFFLALYLRKEKRLFSGLMGVLMAGGLSWLLSRLAYWYFRPDSYGNLQEALSWGQPGGTALMGAFAGCLLTAAVLRLLGLEKDLPDLLDCMSIAGCLGIAVGRLAPFFNTADRGMVLGSGWGFPWMITTLNPVSGAMESRLATFLLQALAAGAVWLMLLLFYLTGRRKSGDTALLFLLFYGASQVILDSTRYDSLYLRSNGFVSAVQVLSAAAIVVAAAAFGVRLVRAGGWKRWHVLLWLGQGACFGLAGYMEYYVQRHGHQAVFSYSVMAGALGAFLLLTLTSRYLAGKETQKHQAWLAQLAEAEEEVRQWKV